MGLGTSIVLIAVGAILYYAVNVDVSGLELETVGLILLILGILGLVISLIYMFGMDRGRGRREVVEEVPVREREVRPPRDRY